MAIVIKKDYQSIVKQHTGLKIRDLNLLEKEGFEKFKKYLKRVPMDKVINKSPRSAFWSVFKDGVRLRNNPYKQEQIEEWLSMNLFGQYGEDDQINKESNKRIFNPLVIPLIEALEDYHYTEIDPEDEPRWAFDTHRHQLRLAFPYPTAKPIQMFNYKEPDAVAQSCLLLTHNYTPHLNVNLLEVKEGEHGWKGTVIIYGQDKHLYANAKRKTPTKKVVSKNNKQNTDKKIKGKNYIQNQKQKGQGSNSSK